MAVGLAFVGVHCWHEPRAKGRSTVFVLGHVTGQQVKHVTELPLLLRVEPREGRADLHLGAKVRRPNDAQRQLEGLAEAVLAELERQADAPRLPARQCRGVEEADPALADVLDRQRLAAIVEQERRPQPHRAETKLFAAFFHGATVALVTSLAQKTPSRPRCQQEPRAR